MKKRPETSHMSRAADVVIVSKLPGDRNGVVLTVAVRDVVGST
jgi:hypothetical protein